MRVGQKKAPNEPGLHSYAPEGARPRAGRATYDARFRRSRHQVLW
jgi:hypothetical protein